MQNELYKEKAAEATMCSLTHKMVYFPILAVCLSISASGYAADTAPTAVSNPRAALEAKLEREANLQNADDLQKLANDYYKEGNFEKSVELYLKAKDGLQPKDKDTELTESVRKKIERINSMIAKSYYYWAQQLFFEAEQSANTGKYDAAIEFCKKAQEVYPLSKDLMGQAIARYERSKDAANYKDEISMKNIVKTSDPDFYNRSYTIEVLLKQGQNFYKTGQWAKARDKFNEALSQDPYNEVAIDALRRTYLKLIKSGRNRKRAMVLERDAEDAWSSIAPIVTTTDSQSDVTPDQATAKLDTTKNLQNKLQNIKISHIDFEEVPIKAVIQALRSRSRESDPDKIGVNFVLRFSQSDSATDEGGEALEGGTKKKKAAKKQANGEDSEDEELEEESEEEEPMAEGKAPVSTASSKVTLQVDNVTLQEAISFVCKSANLHYKVEDYAVVIAGLDVPLDKCSLKTFAVEKDVFDLSGSKDEDVKKYFENRGVDFPPGSTIKYDDTVSRLFVMHTPEKLEYIERLIKEMNIVDPQVLVQVKFVEIDMNDLQELGFEYYFSRPNNTGKTQNTTPLAAGNYEATEDMYLVYKPIIIANSNSGNSIGNATIYTTSNNTTELLVSKGSYYNIPNSNEYSYYSASALSTKQYGKSITWQNNSQLVRSAQQNPVAYGATSTIQDTMFNWSHYNSDGYRMSATVHAIDQADSTNILSSPRVTTMNGEIATIKMITEKSYPESWSEAELDTVSSNGSGKDIPVFSPSIPEFSEATEEGIVLQVLPLVDDDKYTISLEMTPTILSFVGWTDYSYEIPLGDNGDMYPNTLKMPIHEARTVDTKVMSYDGETIVLGGVIRDRISQVDDQYPILGDIPLIGRLFQSKGRNSAKTNLLIFLTSRLIKPDGTPIRENEERGLPSFH